MKKKKSEAREIALEEVHTMQSACPVKRFRKKSNINAPRFKHFERNSRLYVKEESREARMMMQSQSY